MRLGIVLAAMAVATGAAAQDTAIDSRLKRRADVGVRHGMEAVEASRYATCAVNKRAPMARRLLAATTEAEYNQIAALMGRELTCNNLIGSSDSQIGQIVSQSRDVYRGNLAEALLASGSRPALTDLPLARQYSSPWNAMSGRDIAVDGMATCVAATTPGAVDALIHTIPESDREKAAMRALVPSFGPCLNANARLTANRTAIRAALAEALYHRSFDNPAEVAAASPTKSN